jgi:hypothetical protein
MACDDASIEIAVNGPVEQALVDAVPRETSEMMQRLGFPWCRGLSIKTRDVPTVELLPHPSRWREPSLRLAL